MAIDWVNKGNPNCNGAPVIVEEPKGNLNVKCPNCGSEFNTPKR
jgi:predicted RNA-binding Zn-ribbon protein involved in translation (DUF1610 family)